MALSPSAASWGIFISIMDVPADRLPVILKLLDELLDLPAGEREVWIHRLPQEYSALAPTLKDLLARVDLPESKDFLGSLPKFMAAVPAAIAAVAPGHNVGPYRLLRLVGHGGMAEVWLAERADGLFGRRQFALKLPHRFERESQTAKRMERERDILAGLTHPGIARLYDAGISEAGQPYLAMEYIEGTPLPAYCDAHRLGVAQRLKLFRQVLDAVHYAHSRLVIHRDLKPSNIYVTQDGRVALLDFGIAKLLVEGEARETELTQHGGRALTPSYASPEQITGMPLSTATDVYSLGVNLHELLTGQLPYRLDAKSRRALEDAILEAAPARVSQAVTVQHAEHCATTAAKLAASLRGDLEAIVARAMRKPPAERYAGARAFADDIARHLAHEPVMARQGARAYLLQRFARRHWRSLAAAAAVLLTLLAGIAGTLWQAQIARTEARKAVAVKDFLLDIFQANNNANPDGEQARRTTAEQLLDISRERIYTGLKDQPQVRLDMLTTLGDLYDGMQSFDKSEALARERVASLTRAGISASAELAAAESDLGHELSMQDKGEEAMQALRRALAIMDRIGDTGSHTRGTTLLTMGHVGYLSTASDDMQKVHDIERGAAILDRCCLEDSSRAYARQLLGRIAESRSDFPEADRQYTAFLQLAKNSKITKADPVMLANAYSDIGSFLYVRRRYPEAAEYLRQSVEQYLRTQGPNSMDTAMSKQYLGQTLTAMNRPLDGDPLLLEAVRVLEQTQGEGNVVNTAGTRAAVAEIKLLRGDLPSTESLLQKNASIFHTADAPTCTGHCARSYDMLAIVALCRGETEVARDYLARAQSSWLAVHSDKNELYGRNRVLMTKLRAINGSATEVLSELQAVQTQWPASAEDLPAPYMFAGLEAINVQLQIGADAAAAEAAQALLAKLLALPAHSYLADWEAQARRLHGIALARGGRAGAAEIELRRAVDLRQILDVADSPWLAEARMALADVLVTQHKLEEARALAESATQTLKTHAKLDAHYGRALHSLRARLRMSAV